MSWWQIALAVVARLAGIAVPSEARRALPPRDLTGRGRAHAPGSAALRSRS